MLRSDEIYANSVFGKADFQSAAQLAASLPPALQAASANLCHVVFGLSKDWCGPQRSVERCGICVEAVLMSQGHSCEQCTHAPGLPRESACTRGRCANGLRVGCLYTRNPALLGIFDNLGYFASISTPTQARGTAAPHTFSCIVAAVATSSGRRCPACRRLWPRS